MRTPFYLRWRSMRTWALMLLLCVHVDHAGCDQPSQYDCEEAVAYIQKCCPQGAARPSCVYANTRTVTGGGCQGNIKITITHYEPAVQGALASCLRGASCDQLQSSGACSVSGWLIVDPCSTTSTSQTYPGYAGSQGTRTTTTTTTCNTAPQIGPCSGYRPADTCSALQQLSCP